MMTLEKLAAKIFKECEKEGEPVTMDEALEMAEMEINAKGHYEQNAAKVRKPVSRKRKVDETKKRFLNGFKIYLQDCGAIVEMPKNEVELNFKFGDDDYTVKLTRHKKRG